MKRFVVAMLVVAVSGLPGAQSAAAAQEPRIPAEVLNQYKTRDTGRYLVWFRDKADLRVPAAIAARDARRRAVVDALRSTAARSQARVLGLLADGRASGAVSEFRQFWIVNAIAVRSNEAVLRALAGRPEVRAIAPDRKRRIVRSTPVQLRAAIASVSPDWNVEKVGAPAAWAAGVDGSGAVVANIDTGVEFDHPSVASRYRGAGGSHDYAWRDSINGLAEPYDDNAHGTHTMGTMIGGDGAGPDTADIGVAPGATWIAAKAFDEGGGAIDSWLLDSAQFLTAPTRIDGSEPRPELAPDVINNSWGGGSCDPFFDDVLTAWRAMSIFPAFAIGNSGPGAGSAGSPGDSPLAFGVGATAADDLIADFSSRGPSCHQEIKPEVSAPGVAVRSSVPGGGFSEFDGTSMAAPHVAGAVALMVQASGGEATVDEMEEALKLTAVDRGPAGADNDYGAGIIRVHDAVQIVLQGGTLTGKITASGGAPIAGASVVAEIAGGRTGRALTAADGTYRMRVVEGAYTVTASAFGYLPRSAPAVVVRDQTTTLNFALSLAPRVTLSGVVREGPASTVLSGATVTALATPLPPVVTNSKGKYSIVVPVGTYDFEARRGNCLSRARTTLTVSANKTHDFTLPRKLDAYGYVCDEGSFTHEAGTAKLPLDGWDSVAAVTLPFTFNFYGKPFQQMSVYSNGYVNARGTEVESVNRTIPLPDAPRGAIYALWDDLFVRGSARGVYTGTFGKAPNRRFVIEYRNFELSETGDLLNFAIVLGENGTFETRYRSLEGRGNGISATVGIQDLTGSSGILYSMDEPSLYDGLAIKYKVGSVGIVTGTVTGAADALPIEGAAVTAGGPVTRTAVDGTYRLAAFPGSYTITASAEGWESASQSVSLSSGSTRRRDFALAAPLAGLEPRSLSFQSAHDPVSATLTLRNSGVRPLEYSVSERPFPVPLRTIVDDPDDDAPGEFPMEVTALLASAADDVATFRLEVTPESDLSNIGGAVHLDTDQDPSTGRHPSDYYGGPDQDIGFDFFADLWSVPWGEVVIFDSNFDFVTSVPASMGATALTFAVPLVALGGDDGAIDVTASVFPGFADNDRDLVPDFGHGTVPTDLDLAWLEVSPASGSLAPGGTQALVVTADPAQVAAGLHQAEIRLSSNDPRAPLISVEVTFDVPDTHAPTSTLDPSPANVVIVSALGHRVTGSSKDAESGIDSVVVRFTDRALGVVTDVAADLTCTDDFYGCTWTAAPPGAGWFDILVIATDRAGNSEANGPTATIVAA